MNHIFGRTLLAMLLVVMAVPAMAHPGHGASDSGIEHYVTEPAHFGTAFGVIVAVGLVASLAIISRSFSARRLRWRRPSPF